jgi:hypothetical protein
LVFVAGVFAVYAKQRRQVTACARTDPATAAAPHDEREVSPEQEKKLAARQR